MRISILILIMILVSSIDIFGQETDDFLMYTPESQKYPVLIKKIIIKSSLMDLDDKEKGYIEYLERFYLKIINEKTKEFEKNSSKITRTINNKNRSLKDARKSVRRNAQLYLEIGYTFIESLEYLKKNLGRTKFDKLFYSNEISLFNDMDFGLSRMNSEENDEDDDTLESTGIEEEEGEIEQ